MDTNIIIQGDCLEKLKTLPDNSVDAVVTDPPYELGFMGKSWDNTGIANNVDMWSECLRVLKPGGHLLSFSGTRTYHRMASAIEDAGFEVRDMIEWVYGSGFPKSLNIGKAVDKIQGNEREEFEYEHPQRKNRSANYTVGFSDSEDRKNEGGSKIMATKGTSEWEGWGTALKPAHEPICMARKPLAEKTVAENCLKWGVGGINIDGSRVEGKLDGDPNRFAKTDGGWGVAEFHEAPVVRNEGRFPANLIHDNSEEVRECFPETKGGGSQNGSRKWKGEEGEGGFGGWAGKVSTDHYISRDDGTGNASRFFRAIPNDVVDYIGERKNFKSIIYTAKASKSERNKGCEGLEDKIFYEMDNDHGNLGHFMVKKAGGEMGDVQLRKNNHPTVKPVALMEYLIKMVTPKGGIVLDPFAGSGSTLVAAKQNGFQYIGIEKEAEYVKIAEARLSAIRVENKLF